MSSRVGRRTSLGRQLQPRTYSKVKKVRQNASEHKSEMSTRQQPPFSSDRNTNILQYLSNYSTASALEQAVTKPHIQQIRTEILQHWTRNVSAAGFASAWFRSPLVPGCSSSADYHAAGRPFAVPDIPPIMFLLKFFVHGASHYLSAGCLPIA